MTPETYIPGGIECCVHLNNDKGEAEVIFDLTDWVRKQYCSLLETSRQKHKDGVRKSNSFCILHIGDDQVIVILETTLSKFKSYYHPAISESDNFKSSDIFFESPDIDVASYEVARRALKVINVT